MYSICIYLFSLVRKEIELEYLHQCAAAQLLQWQPSLITMAKTKADAQEAPKKGRAKGAMHEAGVAAARAKAAVVKKRKSNIPSDEQED
jgi:hypothetical protein